MPIMTTNGRFLGRKKDKEDRNDQRFMSHHVKEMASPYPQKVDLTFKYPQFNPPLDQLNIGSCGPNAAARWIKQFYPKINISRLDLYYKVRRLEGTTGEDSGVETRDLFKVLQQEGAISEEAWPYDTQEFMTEPPTTDAAGNPLPVTKIGLYTRIASPNEVIAALASGRSYVMGFEVPASFDDAEIQKGGVLRFPQRAEPFIGGHDTHVVGYDLNFRKSDVFKNSGVDPALMTDHAIKVENSWSEKWGLGGYFWMSLVYAIDKSTGADNWTGRLNMGVPHAGFNTIRR